MDKERGARKAEQRSWLDLPWGFFLVLAAIIVVAAMYTVTMRSIPDIAPETAVGAMSGALALIGTLVGTYFGIKAGLDGQQKLKDTLTSDVERSRGSPQEAGPDGYGDRGRGEQRVQEPQRTTREGQGEAREDGERGREEAEEQLLGWEGGSR